MPTFAFHYLFTQGSDPEWMETVWIGVNNLKPPVFQMISAKIQAPDSEPQSESVQYMRLHALPMSETSPW